MNKYSKNNALLGRNIKQLRNRFGLTQHQLALKIHVSATFMSDIETGKKWVSSETLSTIAKALKVEIYELFKPEQETIEDIDAAIISYLDDVDAVIIKAIEEAVKPAVKRSVMKMREYWTKERWSRDSSNTNNR